MDLEDFIYGLSSARGEAELYELIPPFIGGLGFEFFLVADASLGSIEAKDGGVIMTNFPCAWVEEFLAIDCADRAGLLLECSRLNRSLRLEEMASWDHSKISSSFKKASRLGLENGELLLVSGPGGERFGFFFGSRSARLDASSLPVLRVASFALLESLVELSPKAAGPKVKLTERERKILELIAEGKTKREVAELLEVSEACVKRHCESSFEKLAASNLPSAVSKAMGLGLIRPVPAA